MLLKEIPGLLPTLAGSALAKSKLWNQDVSLIHPSQLVAVRMKTLMNDPHSKIDQEINFLVQHILFAHLDNLCDSPLINYYRPSDDKITTTEFISGLKKIPPEYRLALLFGMEMGLSVIRIRNLTVKQAFNLSDKTEIANSVLRSALLSCKTIHMFWRVDENGDHVSLDDIGEVIYGAYGCSWLELKAKYKFMVADHYNPIIFSDYDYALA